MDLPEGAAAGLLKYLALIEKWNRTYNLTAIRSPLDMVSHHLLDSLAVVSHLPMAPHALLADVGTGAGLPGIPLAIARPHWRITLNDSSQKKTAFLRQAAIDLGLANVEVHEGRAESWRPATPFAVVISRAFAELADFASRCRHLVAPEGVLAAMTGAAPEASPGEVISLKVPLLHARRHLVLWRVGGTQ
ncbi:MAG TPA: 16S rRNA (guanine(527)-N(7))-methyltransferase RsmG [Burkholderiales bacterium]|nr:16S rRNA (guanine(527)-N(7))-methyltransferase RsmG [Burkholderiales bacterium]